MLPLYDENDTERVPFVTISLIAANVLVFIWQSLSFNGDIHTLFREFGTVPATFLAHPASLHSLTFFSSMFMHGDIWHLLGNMWFLWIFGDNVEDRMGPMNFLFFYLGCGILADLTHVVTNAHSLVPTIGASGAISGVLGAYMVLFPDAQVRTWIGRWYGLVSLPAWMVLGQWVFMQWLVAIISKAGSAGGVAIYAHIGGFVAGFLLVHLFNRNRSSPQSDPFPSHNGGYISTRF